MEKVLLIKLYARSISRFTLAAMLMCSCSTVHIPVPGAPIPRGAAPLFVAHKGGQLCAGSIDVNRVRFNFDVRCGENIILYVQTLDPGFVTSGGLRVGATVAQAVKAGGRLLDGDSGNCGVLLPSGWIAHPGIGSRGSSATRQSCRELLNESIVYFDRR